MATTKLFLDLRAKAKDGKGSVIIIISHNRTSTSIRTGLRLLPSEWDGSRVIARDDADALNVDLYTRKTNIDKKITLLTLNEGIDYLTASQIKDRIADTPKASVVKNPSLNLLFREYMQTEMQEGTRTIYSLTLGKVVSFAGNSVKIEDVTYRWLLDFEKFLAKTQGVNGRAIYMRALRTICNYARNIGAVSSYAFENFSIKQEPTKSRNISVEDLRNFHDYPIKPSLESYRDYFFLMFYLIGINAADLFMAKPESVVNGRIEYIRKKTHKKYSIKIEPEAQFLIDKYKGKNYLLCVMDRCKSYKNFLHEMNDALKLIGPTTLVSVPSSDDLFGEYHEEMKVKPIIPNISSYYSRHTWATLAYETGVPLDIISQALGHSSGNRTTLVYVKFDQTKVDDANRKVIDYFLGIN